MRSVTRNQEYKYQYKTVAITNYYFCGAGPRLNVSIPENLLDIKAIFLHAVLRFDASTPAAQRRIYWAGGSYSIDPITGIPKPSEDSMIFVNMQADPVTRIADLKVDLTRLKDKLIQNPLLGEHDQPSIELDLITSLTGDFVTIGDVILWKVDFVYTTTGIQ